MVNKESAEFSKARIRISRALLTSCDTHTPRVRARIGTRIIAHARVRETRGRAGDAWPDSRSRLYIYTTALSIGFIAVRRRKSRSGKLRVEGDDCKIKCGSARYTFSAPFSLNAPIILAMLVRLFNERACGTYMLLRDSAGSMHYAIRDWTLKILHSLNNHCLNR